MAVKDILTHFDFKKSNELRNALVHKLAAAPSEPVEGQIYYDTVLHKFFYYNGTEFVASDLSALEAGDALTKTGNKLDVAPGTNLEISSDTIRIAATAAGSGLGGGAAEALKVNVGTGIEISSDAVRIAATAAGAGIGGGGGSALSIAAGTGITIETDGVAVDTTVIATREFAEALINGTDNKASVRAATTANITIATALNNADVLDGVTLATGDRVLVKNQTTKKENGIYIVGASPARATDADISAEVTSGLYVFVSEGTVNASSGWQLFTKDPITLGTTELVFEQVSGAGQITAGAGLTKTGNVLDVGEGAGIKVEADKIVLDTAVAVRKFAGLIGTGAATEIEVEHKLGTEDVTVQVWQAGGEKLQVDCGVQKISTEKIKLLFNVAPTSNQYRVVVHG